MSNEQSLFETRRFELHEKLVQILGTRNVYYQPTENTKIKYPAIIYERYDMRSRDADNLIYLATCIYHVTVVDSDPDSIVVDKMSKFCNARFVNHRVYDGMNHDTFKIYY